MSKSSFGFLTGCVALASIIIILVLAYPENIIFVGGILSFWGLAAMQYYMEAGIMPVRFKITSEGIYFPYITRSRKNAYLSYHEINGVIEQPAGNLIFYPLDLNTKGVFRLGGETVGKDTILIIRKQLLEHNVKFI
jgi:hypothetical protein